MVGVQGYPTHEPQLAAAYRVAGYWTDETPQQWLAGQAERRPEAPALFISGRRLSYGDLHQAATRFAAGLRGLGFRKGDVVAVQLPNIPEFLIAYHGISMMGGVVGLLHMPYRRGELLPLLAHGNAKGVVCYGGLPGYEAAATMLELRDAVPTLEHVIVAGGDASGGAVGLDDLLAVRAGGIDDPPTADDPAVLAFTSGTSASPKAVVHTYRTLACSHRHLSVDCGLGTDDAVLSAPPFTHIYGICVANITLHAGGASALLPLYTPPRFAECLETLGPTVVFCGPAHILAAMKAGLLSDRSTRSIKRIILAGSACPPELVAEIEARCAAATVYQMWGMTEVLMSTINPLDASREVRQRSVGTPPAGHEVRTVDDAGQVLKVGGEGELQIRGPFVFAGYFDNEAVNREAFSADGWYRTGDLATLDEDRNIVLTGRTKDIINRGGIKINPVDVEGLIDEHPDILQSAIVPMADEVLGEKACLCGVLRPGASVSLDEVTRYLDERGVAKMQWPERLEVVEEMPLTPTRKIMKGRLTELVATRMNEERDGS